MTELDHVLQCIKQRGNWLVVVRPKNFEKGKLNLKTCKDIVLKSIVSRRPYNYPHYYANLGGDDPFSSETDYVQCITDIRPHMGAKSPPLSVWRMYQSGQFLHRFSCVEDYWEVSAGKNVLSVTSTLYIITEIYEFASRVAENDNILDDELSIRIALHNMKDRSLVEINPGEPYTDRLLYLDYKCRDNDLSHQKEMTLSNLIGASEELAMDHTLSILNKFGWKSASYLGEAQNNFLKNISSPRPIEYPISVDDPSRDKKIFRDRVMQEICRRYKYLRRNTDSTEFVFVIDDIRKPSMEGFEKPYFVQKLPELEKEEGYIEIIPGERIRLTNRGIKHCEASDHIS